MIHYTQNYKLPSPEQVKKSDVSTLLIFQIGSIYVVNEYINYPFIKFHKFILFELKDPSLIFNYMGIL